MPHQGIVLDAHTAITLYENWIRNHLAELRHLNPSLANSTDAQLISGPGQGKLLLHGGQKPTLQVSIPNSGQSITLHRLGALVAQHRRHPGEPIDPEQEASHLGAIHVASSVRNFNWEAMCMEPSKSNKGRWGCTMTYGYNMLKLYEQARPFLLRVPGSEDDMYDNGYIRINEDSFDLDDEVRSRQQRLVVGRPFHYLTRMLDIAKAGYQRGLRLENQAIEMTREHVCLPLHGLPGRTPCCFPTWMEDLDGLRPTNADAWKNFTMGNSVEAEAINRQYIHEIAEGRIG